MASKRVLIFCVMLALLAAALQAVPHFLGADFIFAAVLGGIPVYIAARIDNFLGIAVYLITAVLTAFIDPSESIYFICTNGIIGLSLGISKNGIKSMPLVPIPSALMTIGMLFWVNYLLGISIFGYSSLKTPVLQALTLFLPLYIYCFIYLKLSEYVYNWICTYIELNNH